MPPENDPTPDPKGDQEPDPKGDQEPEPKGDEGDVRDPKKVLELNEKYRSENKGLRDRLKAFEETAEEKRLAALSDNERAIEEARVEAKAEAQGEFRQEILRERVLARSTGLAVDPGDVFALLDTSDLDPDDGEAITVAIEALLDAKPHLRKVERRGINQGPQGGAPNPKSGNDWLRGTIGGRR